MIDEPKLKALFGQYLYASYTYYIKDISIMPDTEFDFLCKKLLVNWDKFEHRSKHLITKEALEAGTGFDIKFTPQLVSAFELALSKEKLP